MANEFIARNGITSLGNVVISGSLTTTGAITMSGSVASASFAATASSADNLLVRNTLTAQTLVVQTITSSVDFVTGSTKFGSIIDNTHQFTGSILVSGSMNGIVYSKGSNFKTWTVGEYAYSSNYTTIELNADTEPRIYLNTNGGGNTILYNSYGSVGLYFESGSYSNNILYYTNSNKSLVIGAGGATRIFVSGSGNVGIGTTTPGNKLDVIGNMLVQGTQGFNAAGETASIYIGDTASEIRAVYDGGLDFYQNTTFRMRIQGGTGNVGIGTSSPSYQLDLGGGATVNQRLRLQRGSDDTNQYGVYGWNQINLYRANVSISSAQTDFAINQVGSDGSRTPLYITSGGNIVVGGGAEISVADSNLAISNNSITASRALVFYSANSYNPRAWIKHVTSTGAQSLEFNSTYGSGTGTANFNFLGGNVGIGTTSPSVKLHVADSGGGRLILQGVGGSGINWQFNSYTDGKLYIGNYGVADYFALTNAGTLYINSTTNQLNNATPQLGILAGANTDAINIKHTQNGNNTLNIWQTGASTFRAIAFYKGDTQTAVGEIACSTTSTTYTTTSDYRLKTNIRTLENGLDRVMRLKPSKFNWTTTGEEAEGFIAHEVQEVFPDAVTGEKDAIYSSTGNIKPQSVDYGRISPLLVKAIQELKAENDSLKLRIEALENK